MMIWWLFVCCLIKVCSCEFVVVVGVVSRLMCLLWVVVMVGLMLGLVLMKGRVG